MGLPPGGFDSGRGADVIELAEHAGLIFDPWQRWFIVEVHKVLGEKWAAFIAWLFLGRQNGKGSVQEGCQLAGLMWWDRFAIHTAHELKTTAEHFLRMQQLIEGCPEIDSQVMRIRTGKGDEAIEMKNGNRLRFISRSGGSGRGFAGVDRLYLDEVPFIEAGMIQAIFSTMAARSRQGNPQMVLSGSAPYGPLTEAKSGDALRQAWAHGQVGMLRDEKRRPPNTLYVDYGCRPPTEEQIEAAGSVDAAVVAMVEDRDLWFAGNPALGERITEVFCEQELATLGAKGFAVERLGLVIPSESDNRSGIDLDEWARTSDNDWSSSPGVVVGVDVDDAGARGSLVAAQTINGRPHVEIVEQGGVGQLVDFLCRQDAGVVGRVVFDKSSNGRLVVALLAARPDGVALTARCEPVPDAVGAQVLFARSLPVHRSDGRLRAAILAAVQVPVGERWRWGHRKSAGDVTALRAAAFAAAECGEKKKSLTIL